MLISGAMDGWPAWERWTKSGLLEAYGEQTVQVRRSSAIATDAEFGGQHARNMTVYDYLAKTMLPKPHDESCEEEEMSDPEYMFAQDPLVGLRQDYGNPTYFKVQGSLDFLSILARCSTDFGTFQRKDRNRYGYSSEERAETALFYVGPEGSGVNFHQHTNAWNALFFGRKRWFMFPPYTIFGPTALPMQVRRRCLRAPCCFPRVNLPTLF